MSNFRNREIDRSFTLIGALRKMDVLDKKLLILVENDIFFGLLSAGDIQRAILQNKALETKVIDVVRENIKVGKVTDSLEDLRNMILEYRMEFCPIIDDQERIIEILFWEDIFGTQKHHPLEQFKVPVVIMAGGFGTRLKPITNVLPKPLIPLGDKTILEEIFHRFNVHGCNEFHISVNYKAELIKYYIESQNLTVNTHFFTEDKPMGTAGSLSLLRNNIKSTFFVTNCDIIINQDYSEILKFHQDNKNEITLVAAFKHLEIPYGTVKMGKGGELTEIAEKPELNFLVNAGMYVLEPHLLNEIPEDTFYHITFLIEALKEQKRKVGVFPVSEGSWMDIGQWDEYNRTSKKLGYSGINI